MASASSAMSSNESMLSYFHFRRSGRRIDSQETLILGESDGDTELPDSRPVEFDVISSSAAADVAAFSRELKSPMRTCLLGKPDDWWTGTVMGIENRRNSPTRTRQPWGRTGSGFGPVTG